MYIVLVRMVKLFMVTFSILPRGSEMLHGFMEKSRKFQKWKWHSKCYKQIIGNTKVDRVQEKSLKYSRNIYIYIKPLILL